MSSYATLADLTSLGVPAAALLSVSAGDQQKAIDSASALADGYLATHYTLPLTSYGKDLTQQICAIAAYTLLVTRGYNPDDAADTELRDRYEDAIRWLERISEGKISPAIVDSSVTHDAGGPFTAQMVAGGNDAGIATGPASTTQSTPNGIVRIGRPSVRGW